MPGNMELCCCDDEDKEKCTDCVNEWRYLCRSQRTCDFDSGDGEYDNQRQSGPFWSCLCWCVSCWCLCPRALWRTFVACLYVTRTFCLACLIILLCGACYLCANCSDASCGCSQCQPTSEPQLDRDHHKESTGHQKEVEDIV